MLRLIKLLLSWRSVPVFTLNISYSLMTALTVSYHPRPSVKDLANIWCSLSFSRSYVKHIGLKNSGVILELRVLVGIGRSGSLRGIILSSWHLLAPSWCQVMAKRWKKLTNLKLQLVLQLESDMHVFFTWIHDSRTENLHAGVIVYV